VKISESQVRKIIRQEMSRGKKRRLFEAYPADPTPVDMDNLRKELAPWGAIAGTTEPDAAVLNAWKKFVYDEYEPLTRGSGGVSIVTTAGIPSPLTVYNDWDAAAPDLGFPPKVAGMLQFINTGGKPAGGSPAATALTANMTTLLDLAVSSATAAVGPALDSLENLDPSNSGTLTSRSAADVVWAWRNVKKVIDEDSTQLQNTRVLIARYATESGDFISPDQEWLQDNPGKAALALFALGAFGSPIPGSAVAFAAGGFLASWWASFVDNQTTTSIAAIIANMSNPALGNGLAAMSSKVKQGVAGQDVMGRAGAAWDSLFGTGDLGAGNPFGQALTTLALVFKKAAADPGYRKTNAAAALDQFLQSIESAHPNAVESFRQGKIISGALDERKMIRREIDLAIRSLTSESKLDRSREIIRSEIRSQLSETLGLSAAEVDQMARTYRDEEVEGDPPVSGIRIFRVPPTGGGGGGACVRRLQKVVIPHEIDGVWGPNTEGAFHTFIKTKFEELGLDHSGVYQQKWSSSGAGAASALLDPTFDETPCGAAEFVEHLAGQQGQQDTGETISVQGTETIGGGQRGKQRGGGAPRFKFRQGSWQSRAMEIILNPQGQAQDDLNAQFATHGVDNVDKIRIIFADQATADNAAENGITEDEFMSATIKTGRGIGGRASRSLDGAQAWSALKAAGIVS